MRDADGRYKGQSLSGEKQLSVSEAVRTLINNLFRAGGARGLGARPSNVLGLGCDLVSLHHANDGSLHV